MSPFSSVVAISAPPLDALEIYVRYLASLQAREAINNTQNAVVRYFIPSVGGPTPSAQKRRPLAPEEIEAALQFLKTILLEVLANAPDWASKTLKKLDSAPAQRERVRRDLKSLVDWARASQYLSPLSNPIPEGICHYIKVGLYEGLPLIPINARLICERFLQQSDDETLTIDATNAIVRFFVPGCGGPFPFNKPALEFERQASFDYLETVPLEYLNEAIPIATAVLQVLDCSETHGTRIRNALRALLDWARAERYLPHTNAVAPWGGELLSNSALMFTPLEEPEVPKALEVYEQYCQHLSESGKEKERHGLQTGVIRHLVPMLGGPVPEHKRSMASDIQAGLDYLRTIPLEQLLNSLDQVEVTPKAEQSATATQGALLSRLKSWQRWAMEQYCQDETTPEPTPEFNTFYRRGLKRPRKRPGQKLHLKSCPVHALCAKKFPNDYINSDLQKQLDSFQAWRQKNEVNPGGIKVEMEQILQVMGWLHHRDGVALADLSFEKMIAKSQLRFQAAKYRSYYQYLHQKEIGIQAAREQADQDKERAERYLTFTGDNPKSQARRLFILLAIAKFLYQDLLGSDDFPTDRDIPVLRRLLDLQAAKKEKSKFTLPTVSYGDTSVAWEEAAMAMEQVRRRVGQVSTCQKSPTRKGYVYVRRPDSAIANDLQRFLSIAFCLLIPSRSRTFYDLRLGETFKEGILTPRTFLSVQALKESGDWEQRQEEIRFYIHHTAADFKTGKSMTPALQESGGWWAEIPNLAFAEGSLYDYIRRWLTWGRGAKGPVHHNFFFRLNNSPRPLTGHAWSSRLKTLFERWTGVPVPPKNIRKMFSSQFPEHEKSAALLLQHSEKVHSTRYDMRDTIIQLRPVMQANEQFIQKTLGVSQAPEIGMKSD